MKLYLIQCSKTGKTYSQFTNKKEAEKELRRMNKGESEICSPRGIEKPYRLEVDNKPFIVVEYGMYENSLLSEFSSKKEAVEETERIFNCSDSKAHNEEFIVGLKDYKSKNRDYAYEGEDRIYFIELKKYER